MYIIGVDQSATNSGVAVLLDNKLIATYNIVPKGLTGGARLAYIIDRLRNILSKYPSTDLVVMEAYSYGSTNKAFTLGEAGGAIKLCAHLEKRKLLVVWPTQVKKFTTGNGGATKQAVKKALSSQYDVSDLDDNVTDAIGLALVGRAFLSPTELTKHQQEVVDVLKTKKQNLNIRTNDIFTL